MHRYQFIGRISFKPLAEKKIIFSSSFQHHSVYNNVSETDKGMYFDIHMQCNQLEVSALVNDQILVLCIGYSFHNEQLAQTVASTYLASGLSTLRAVQGCYCSIIVDKKRLKSFLYCDHAGILPLYYTYDPSSDTLLFANTLKGVILNSSGLNEFNYKVLYELFHVGMINPPDTLLKNVYVISSSNYVSYSRQVKLHDFGTPSKQSVHYDEDELYHELIKSILPLIKQPNISVMCSGGLDSSLISALIRKQSCCEMSLFTLFFEEKHTDVMNTQHLGRQYDAQNFYFKPGDSDLITTILDTLWLGEGESVGTLSSNIALELLFAQFISGNSKSQTLVTGDINSLKTESSPSVQLYSKKYALLPTELCNRFFKTAKQHGYLEFLLKYYFNKEENRLFFPEVLVLRLTGKIRLNTAPYLNYFLPYLDVNYTQYIENLHSLIPDFNYRLALARLAKNQHLLSKELLLTPKSWMPGWLKYTTFKECILFFIGRCTQKESFCTSIFGQVSHSVFQEAYQQQNLRFIIACYYLEVFYQSYIANPFCLISKDSFIASNRKKGLACPFGEE